MNIYKILHYFEYRQCHSILLCSAIGSYHEEPQALFSRETLVHTYNGKMEGPLFLFGALIFECRYHFVGISEGSIVFGWSSLPLNFDLPWRK